LTAAALPLPRFPKPWVQLPLFGRSAWDADAPRGVVVQLSNGAKEAQAIIRLVMSLKPPLSLSLSLSAANASEITPAPDSQLFVRRSVKLQVFGARKKIQRKGSALDKAVAAVAPAALDAEPRSPK